MALKCNDCRIAQLSSTNSRIWYNKEHSTCIWHKNVMIVVLHNCQPPNSRIWYTVKS